MNLLIFLYNNVVQIQWKNSFLLLKASRARVSCLARRYWTPLKVLIPGSHPDVMGCRWNFIYIFGRLWVPFCSVLLIDVLLTANCVPQWRAVSPAVPGLSIFFKCYSLARRPWLHSTDRWVCHFDKKVFLLSAGCVRGALCLPCFMFFAWRSWPPSSAALLRLRVFSFLVPEDCRRAFACMLRRQRGPVVRVLALRSGDPGFKTRSDHLLNLVVPGSTSQLHL